jgi:hypothetical protein
MLFLPNWQTVFNFIDYVSACIERGTTMPGANADPNCAVTDRQQANAMDATYD